MDPRARPESIDTRLVLRAYASIAITSGVLVYFWPLLYGWPRVSLDLAPYGGSDPRTWGAMSLLRSVAAVVVGFGCCASALAVVGDPIDRRRGLIRFAVAHLVFGAMFLLQWVAILEYWLPPAAGFAPLIVGVVLLYLAVTAPGSDMSRLPARSSPRTNRDVATSPFATSARASSGCARSTRNRSVRPRDRKSGRGWRAICTTR